MRATCALQDNGPVLFTLNTSDYDLRVDDLIEAALVTYKVESVVLKVTPIPDVTVPLTVDPQTGETLTSETVAGNTGYWSEGELAVTLSVVP